MSKLAVLGGGNLGRALALGWVGAGRFSPSDIHITRRKSEKLADALEVKPSALLRIAEGVLGEG